MELSAGGTELEGDRGGYTVVNADVTATMQRSGWVEITKRDGITNAPLGDVEFTLYSTDGNDTVIRTGKTTADGKLTLRGLPVGTYRLQETDKLSEYKEHPLTYTVTVTKEGTKPVTSIDGQTGDDSNKITIRNYQENTVGDLTIRKVTTGANADTNKEFDFTVTVAGASGTYEYLGTGGKADGTLNFVDGSATFVLKHGESITIKHLPKDAAYTVEEEDYSSERYRTTKTGEVGSIIADDTVTAAFVNTKPSLPVPTPTGGLMITKTVTGEGADRTKQFAFTVTLGKAGEAYEYSGVGVPGGTLVSGDTVMLGHGQSITITGLLSGTSYTVVERDYTADGYVTTTDYASGTIVADAIMVARFVNTKDPGIGDGGTATIELQKVDADQQPLAGAKFTLYDADGEVVQIVTSGAGGIVRFVDVPLGSYTIRETRAPQGYEALSGELGIMLTLEGEVVQTNPYMIVNVKTEQPDEPEKPTDPETPGGPGDPDEPIEDGESPGGPGIIDPNGPGEELPKAGGFLDTAMLVAGGVLMILAGLGYAFMKRRIRDNVA